MSLVKLDHVALDGAKLKANATRGGYVTELMCLQGGLLTGRPRTGAAIVIYSEAMVIKRSAPKSVILRHLRPPRND